MILKVNIDLDQKCPECNKGGSVNNGLCLDCLTKAMRMKPMKSAQGKATQERMRKSVRCGPKEFR